jgi:hypothetical protein
MKLIGIVLILCAQGMAAQGTRPAEIGMTRGQVVARLGAPKSYLSRGVYYRRFPFLSIYPVLDVYQRTVHGRRYEIQLVFELDEAASLLHPPARVSEIHFQADRPTPAGQLLSDFTEARLACAKGCDVFGGSLQGTGNVIRVRQPTAAKGRQLEVEVTNWRSLEGTATPVESLDDLATGAVMTDYTLYAEYAGREGDTTEKLGVWPPS